MNATEVLRIVDAIHRDKNIEQEIVFEGIEAALVSAAKKHYGEEAEIVVQIDRKTGEISATCDGQVLDSEETIGRIGAQTAKQVMIQKNSRSRTRCALRRIHGSHWRNGQWHSPSATRAVRRRWRFPTSKLSLPRSEQIPGESHHVNERVRGHSVRGTQIG